MKDVFLYLMIYAGSALMAYNIYGYICFFRDVWGHGNWDREQRLFNLPILLLVLFFIGYLVVGIFGKPDLVMAGILFGGSIFVFVMLLLIRRTFDRIRENEQLEVKLSAAEEASKAKTFFLSNMSHDIRTPLNAIIGYTSLAKREEATHEDKDEYIDKIEIASRQLLEIVNDVLDMSRIESGKFSLEPSCVNLEDCVQEVSSLVRTQLEAKKNRVLRLLRRFASMGAVRQGDAGPRPDEPAVQRGKVYGRKRQGIPADERAFRWRRDRQV